MTIARSPLEGQVGPLLGAIIGDINGSIYERQKQNIKTKDFELFTESMHITDDTVMTVAVADALLAGGTANDFIDAMRTHGRAFPEAGYGGTFGDWLASDSRAPYGSWGNGSAMRVSPVAWWGDTEAQVESLAEVSASVTHDHPEGIRGAQAVAAAVYLARTGRSRQDMKEHVEARYGYDLDRSLDQLRPTYALDRIDVSCQGSVPIAIRAYLESTGFEDAIRNAISMGGDSDTIAAMAGSIAEAEYGVPRTFAERALVMLPPGLRTTLERFWLRWPERRPART